jgi:cobalt-zinc-cadmium efflux system outer membrane protein
MFARVAAFAACLAMLALPAHADGPLTLDDAMARVVAHHPDLRAFAPLRDVREAERAAAALPPPLLAGVSLENVAGNGDARLLTGMELTLSLASVLERDGKRDARAALASQRIDALARRREAMRLDLLAETARRYLDVVHARELLAVARADVAQRQRAVEGARRRMQAGASPESELLAAEAAHARTRLLLAGTSLHAEAAARHLAALWGVDGDDGVGATDATPVLEVAAADPRVLPAIPDLPALATLLAGIPDLAQFADEQRIREARLQLMRTAQTPDITWQVGVRRLEASDDVALVGSLSMPLGARRYAAPGIDAARAELVALGIEREARGQALHGTLIEAHGRYGAARAEVLGLQQEVLPLLARAERAAERAYRAGAISYLEWAQLQAEQVQVARQQLEVARDAQRALIEIQRLTGDAFVLGTAPQATTNAEQGDAR